MQSEHCEASQNPFQFGKYQACNAYCIVGMIRLIEVMLVGLSGLVGLVGLIGLLYLLCLLGLLRLLGLAMSAWSPTLEHCSNGMG